MIRGLARGALLGIEPAHGGPEFGRIASALVARQGPVALPVDARLRGVVGAVLLRRCLIQRHGLRDVVGAEAGPRQDEWHDALVGVAGIGAPRHPAVLAPHRPARLRHRALEGRAGVPVAIASGVADEPLTAGRALEHRQHVCLAAGGTAESPARARRAPLPDRRVERGIDEWLEAGRSAVAQATGVQRIGQHRADGVEAEAHLRRHLPVGAARGGELEAAADRLAPRRVRLEQRRLANAAEAEGCAAARVGMAPPLGGVALPDAPPQATAVRLGLDRLACPGLPGVLVGTQEALVAEEERGARGVELVARVDRGPQIACEAGHVAHEQHVVAMAGAGEHVGELAGTGHGAPAVGDLPGEPGIDEPVAGKRLILLLALGVGPVAVDLALGGLADPARGPQPAERIE